MDWQLIRDAGSALKPYLGVVIGATLTFAFGSLSQRSATRRQRVDSARTEVRLALEQVILMAQDLIITGRTAARFLEHPEHVLDPLDVPRGESSIEAAMRLMQDELHRIAVNPYTEDGPQTDRTQELRLALVRLQLLLPQLGELGPSVQALDALVKKHDSEHSAATAHHASEDIVLYRRHAQELEDQLGVVINTARDWLAPRR
ncbi:MULTISPECIES: hypothetical protein [unclassified Luteococcus]|uniref:hypothetical protein n=1 Tax=unclassified Luteococcus TaxID=2639923 RepID=UPI00313DAF1B